LQLELQGPLFTKDFHRKTWMPKQSCVETERQSMKISCIYVGTCKRDYHLTQCCVASIRHWYPEIPIYLIKDLLLQDYDTSEMERAWNVSVFASQQKLLGFGWGKVEALVATPSHRALILDSDIVFAGPILEAMEALDDNFVVVEEGHPLESINRDYFPLAALAAYDPTFRFPGFVFNTGQILATTGLLTREDFAPHINLEPVPHVKQPELFASGEQGVLNYLILKKHTEGSISLCRHSFMRWGPSPNLEQLSLREIRKNSSYAFLVHWAGKKSPDLSEIPHAYLLLFFFWKYHQRVPWGWLKYLVRRQAQKRAAKRSHTWNSTLAK